MNKASRLLLTLALLAAVFWFFDIPVMSLYQNISDWRYIALAALLPLTAVPWFSTHRWRFLLRLSGIEERLLALWAINLKALFFGLLLPSSQGSDFVRILLIERRHPKSRGVVGSTVFIERMIGFVLLALFTLAALPVVYGTPQFGYIAAMVVLLNLAALGLILATVLTRQVSLVPGAWAGLIGKGLSYLGKFHGAIVRFPYRQGLLVTLLFIGGFQLSLIFVVYLLFHGFGHPIPFLQHLVFYPLIAVLTLVPITIGGFGIREGAFVYFYSLVGVPPEVCVGVSLVNYLLVLVVPALLGGTVLLFERNTVHGSERM